MLSVSFSFKFGFAVQYVETQLIKALFFMRRVDRVDFCLRMVKSHYILNVTFLSNLFYL